MTAIDIIRLDRHLGLGGSDAKRVIEGDWHSLYLEKVGEVEPVDLTDVFRVQLGIYTEPFHIKWLNKYHGLEIEECMERIFHPDHDFMFCHLDGWDKKDDTFVEVKHSNGRASARDSALYYMPQLQHSLACTGKKHCHFSVIAGNDDPERVIVDRNQEYIDKLIAMETSFWWHVTNKVPPEITPVGTQQKIARIGATTPIDGLRAYDMGKSNAWAEQAAAYTSNEAAAKAFETAKAELKGLVPDDASEASGHGITIKRDRRGALRFS